MKMNKIFFYLLIFSFLNFVGCYSSRAVDKEIYFSEMATESMDDFTIITIRDETIEIKWNTFQIMQDTLYATGLKEESIFVKPVDVKIALTDIKYVEIDEPDDLATTGCVVGIGALVILVIIVIAMASSGPLINWPSSWSEWN